jgi:hypothetical protein
MKILVTSVKNDHYDEIGTVVGYNPLDGFKVLFAERNEEVWIKEQESKVVGWQD